MRLLLFDELGITAKMLAGFIAATELGADVTLTNTGLFLTHRQRGR